MNRTYNFDEWLPWEQNASPMLLVLTLNAGMRELKKYFGMALWTSVIIFEDNQVKWLFRPKELKLLGQKMIDFLMCPPYRVSFLTGYDNTEQSLLEKAQEIQFSIDLGVLQNNELIALFDKYSHMYYSWYKYGWFCEPVQFQSQDLLTVWLEKEAKERQLPFDTAEVQQVLFTVEEDTFAVEILHHLSECTIVLGKALKNPHLANAIKKVVGDTNFAYKAAQITLSMIESGEDENLTSLRDKIKEHSVKFYWKQNNYFSTKFLTEENVLTELFALEGFDISDPVSQIKNRLEQIKENKKRLLSKKATLLGMLPPYERSIAVLASSIGGSLIDRRKKVIMIANAAFDRILGEMAKRTKVEISDCRLLIPQELGDFLSSPQEYHQRFEERRKRFLVFQGDFPLLNELFGDVATREGENELNYSTIAMSEPFIAEGAEADKAIDQLNSRLNFLIGVEAATFDKLQGVAAYYDPTEPIVVATVRIIKDPKSERLETGEILVAPSTTPDYADAIHRCKAIVTDWGGQTSHAAIVSRELKKSCIIGTNYASQVLHNSDKVQLDFRKGMVRVLKSK